VCRSEGFISHQRIMLSAGVRHIIATFYQIESDILSRDEASLSDATWHSLDVQVPICIVSNP
jgi:thymidine phosphorylase